MSLEVWAQLFQALTSAFPSKQTSKCTLIFSKTINRCVLMFIFICLAYTIFQVFYHFLILPCSQLLFIYFPVDHFMFKLDCMAARGFLYSLCRPLVQCWWHFYFLCSGLSGLQSVLRTSVAANKDQLLQLALSAWIFHFFQSRIKQVNVTLKFTGPQRCTKLGMLGFCDLKMKGQCFQRSQCCAELQTHALVSITSKQTALDS